MTPLQDVRGAHLLRYFARLAHSRWLADELEQVLRSGFREVADRVRREGETLDVVSRVRLSGIASDIDRIMASTYREARLTLERRLRFVSDTEYDAARSLIGAFRQGIGEGFVSLGTLTRNTALALAELPIAGYEFGPWWQEQAATMSSRMRRDIQLGILTGEGPATIAKRVLPPRGDFTTPSAFRVARRNAEMFTRTSVTAVHNEASLQSYRDLGPEVVDRVQYAAVLDERTSAVCRGLDGQVWRVGDPGLRKPPLHPNCRSTLLPVLNTKALGASSSPLTGPQTARSYATWLAGQSRDVRVRVLGKSGADRFDRGESLASLAAADIRRLGPDAYAKALRAEGIVQDR